MAGEADQTPGAAAHHGQERLPVGPIAGVAGLVAAGVMWRLGRRRRQQMHFRRTGRTLARNPAAVVAAETKARAIADHEAMRWVDAGLRYLGGQLAQRSSAVAADGEDGSAPPSVVLVRAGSRGLEVMIAPACPDAPDGWVQHRWMTAAVWVRLDADIDLEDLEERAAQRWPFLPALVTVGVTVDGTVLANLEHAGSLAVDGDAETVRAVLGQILIELTSQPWADEMLAGLHALGDAGAQTLAGVDTDGDPMVLAEQLDRSADELVARLDGCSSVAVHRAADCEWLPHVVVAFADTEAPAVRCLVETAVPDRSGIAVVVAGAVPDARWHLERGWKSGQTAVLTGLAGEHPFRLPLEGAGARADDRRAAWRRRCCRPRRTKTIPMWRR